MGPGGADVALAVQVHLEGPFQGGHDRAVHGAEQQRHVDGGVPVSGQPARNDNHGPARSAPHGGRPRRRARPPVFPARVVRKPEEADRIVDQMVENIHRGEMRETEIVAGVGDLTLVGVSAAQIAKRLSVPHPTVNAALAVAKADQSRNRLDTSPGRPAPVRALRLQSGSAEPRRAASATGEDQVCPCPCSGEHEQHH